MGIMEADFWLDRWAQNKIGFHRSTPHPLLERHVHRWSRPGRILVPLSGKSLDLHFLVARGFSVVGVELVEDAVVQFFDEANLVPKIDTVSAFKVYRSDAIDFFVGDFFKLTPQDIGTCDGLYDRAALVALPPELRAQYPAQLAHLLPQAAEGLVVTLDYPPGSLSKSGSSKTPSAVPLEGPPFSVPPAEVEARFADGFEVTRVEENYRASLTGPAANDPKQKQITEHALWVHRLR